MSGDGLLYSLQNITESTAISHSITGEFISPGCTTLINAVGTRLVFYNYVENSPNTFQNDGFFGEDDQLHYNPRLQLRNVASMESGTDTSPNMQDQIENGNNLQFLFEINLHSTILDLGKISPKIKTYCQYYSETDDSIRHYLAKRADNPNEDGIAPKDSSSQTSSSLPTNTLHHFNPDSTTSRLIQTAYSSTATLDDVLEFVNQFTRLHAMFTDDKPIDATKNQSSSITHRYPTSHLSPLGRYGRLQQLLNRNIEGYFNAIQGNGGNNQDISNRANKKKHNIAQNDQNSFSNSYNTSSTFHSAIKMAYNDYLMMCLLCLDSFVVVLATPSYNFTTSIYKYLPTLQWFYHLIGIDHINNQDLNLNSLANFDDNFTKIPPSTSPLTSPTDLEQYNIQLISLHALTQPGDGTHQSNIQNLHQNKIRPTILVDRTSTLITISFGQGLLALIPINLFAIPPKTAINVIHQEPQNGRSNEQNGETTQTNGQIPLLDQLTTKNHSISPVLRYDTIPVQQKYIKLGENSIVDVCLHSIPTFPCQSNDDFFSSFSNQNNSSENHDDLWLSSGTKRKNTVLTDDGDEIYNQINNHTTTTTSSQNRSQSKSKQPHNTFSMPFQTTKYNREDISTLLVLHITPLGDKKLKMYTITGAVFSCFDFYLLSTDLAPSLHISSADGRVSNLNSTGNSRNLVTGTHHTTTRASSLSLSSGPWPETMIDESGLKLLSITTQHHDFEKMCEIGYNSKHFDQNQYRSLHQSQHGLSPQWYNFNAVVIGGHEYLTVLDLKQHKLKSLFTISDHNGDDTQYPFPHQLSFKSGTSTEQNKSLQTRTQFQNIHFSLGDFNISIISRIHPIQPQGVIDGVTYTNWVNDHQSREGLSNNTSDLTPSTTITTNPLPQSYPTQPLRTTISPIISLQQLPQQAVFNGYYQHPEHKWRTRLVLVSCIDGTVECLTLKRISSNHELQITQFQQPHKPNFTPMRFNDNNIPLFLPPPTNNTNNSQGLLLSHSNRIDVLPETQSTVNQSNFHCALQIIAKVSNISCVSSFLSRPQSHHNKGPVLNVFFGSVIHTATLCSWSISPTSIIPFSPTVSIGVEKLHQQRLWQLGQSQLSQHLDHLDQSLVGKPLDLSNTLPRQSAHTGRMRLATRLTVKTTTTNSSTAQRNFHLQPDRQINTSMDIKELDEGDNYEENNLHDDFSLDWLYNDRLERSSDDDDNELALGGDFESSFTTTKTYNKKSPNNLLRGHSQNPRNNHTQVSISNNEAYNWSFCYILNVAVELPVISSFTDVCVISKNTTNFQKILKNAIKHRLNNPQRTRTENELTHMIDPSLGGLDFQLKDTILPDQKLSSSKNDTLLLEEISVLYKETADTILTMPPKALPALMQPGLEPYRIPFSRYEDQFDEVSNLQNLDDSNDNSAPLTSDITVLSTAAGYNKLLTLSQGFELQEHTEVNPFRIHYSPNFVNKASSNHGSATSLRTIKLYSPNPIPNQVPQLHFSITAVSNDFSTRFLMPTISQTNPTSSPLSIFAPKNPIPPFPLHFASLLTHLTPDHSSPSSTVILASTPSSLTTHLLLLQPQPTHKSVNITPSFSPTTITVGDLFNSCLADSTLENMHSQTADAMALIISASRITHSTSLTHYPTITGEDSTTVTKTRISTVVMVPGNNIPDLLALEILDQDSIESIKSFYTIFDTEKKPNSAGSEPNEELLQVLQNHYLFFHFEMDFYTTLHTNFNKFTTTSTMIGTNLYLQSPSTMMYSQANGSGPMLLIAFENDPTLHLLNSRISRTTKLHCPFDKKSQRVNFQINPLGQTPFLINQAATITQIKLLDSGGLIVATDGGNVYFIDSSFSHQRDHKVQTQPLSFPLSSATLLYSFHNPFSSPTLIDGEVSTNTAAQLWEKYNKSYKINIILQSPTQFILSCSTPDTNAIKMALLVLSNLNWSTIPIAFQHALPIKCIFNSATSIATFNLPHYTTTAGPIVSTLLIALSNGTIYPLKIDTSCPLKYILTSQQLLQNPTTTPYSHHYPLIDNKSNQKRHINPAPQPLVTNSVQRLCYHPTLSILGALTTTTVKSFGGINNQYQHRRPSQYNSSSNGLLLRPGRSSKDGQRFSLGVVNHGQMQQIMCSGGINSHLGMFVRKVVESTQVDGALLTNKVEQHKSLANFDEQFFENEGLVFPLPEPILDPSLNATVNSNPQSYLRLYIVPAAHAYTLYRRYMNAALSLQTNRKGLPSNQNQSNHPNGPLSITNGYVRFFQMSTNVKSNAELMMRAMPEQQQHIASLRLLPLEKATAICPIVLPTLTTSYCQNGINNGYYTYYDDRDWRSDQDRHSLGHILLPHDQHLCYYCARGRSNYMSAMGSLSADPCFNQISPHQHHSSPQSVFAIATSFVDSSPYPAQTSPSVKSVQDLKWSSLGRILLVGIMLNPHFNTSTENDSTPPEGIVNTTDQYLIEVLGETLVNGPVMSIKPYLNGIVAGIGPKLQVFNLLDLKHESNNNFESEEEVNIINSAYSPDSNWYPYRFQLIPDPFAVFTAPVLILSLEVDHLQINITTISQGLISITLRPYGLSQDDYLSLLQQLLDVQHPHVLYAPVSVRDGELLTRKSRTNSNDASSNPNTRQMKSSTMITPQASAISTSQKDEIRKIDYYPVLKFVLVNYTPDGKYALTSVSLPHQYGALSIDWENKQESNMMKDSGSKALLTPATLPAHLTTDYNQSLHLIPHDNGTLELVATSSHIKSLATKTLTIYQIKRQIEEILKNLSISDNNFAQDLSDFSQNNPSNTIKTLISLKEMLVALRKHHQEQHYGQYSVGEDPQLFIKQSTLTRLSLYDNFNRFVQLSLSSYFSCLGSLLSTSDQLKNNSTSFSQRPINLIYQLVQHQKKEVEFINTLRSNNQQSFVLQPYHSLDTLLSMGGNIDNNSPQVQHNCSYGVIGISRNGHICRIDQISSSQLLTSIILQLCIITTLSNSQLDEEGQRVTISTQYASNMANEMVQDSNKMSRKSKINPLSGNTSSSFHLSQSPDLIITSNSSASIMAYHSNSPTYTPLSPHLLHNSQRSSPNNPNSSSYLRFCHLTPTLQYALTHLTQSTRFDEQFLTLQSTSQCLFYLFLDIFTPIQQQYVSLLFYQWYIYYTLRIYQLYGVLDTYLVNDTDQVNKNNKTTVVQSRHGQNSNQTGVTSRNPFSLDLGQPTKPVPNQDSPLLLGDLERTIQQFNSQVQFSLCKLLPLPSSFIDNIDNRSQSNNADPNKEHPSADEMVLDSITKAIQHFVIRSGRGRISR